MDLRHILLIFLAIPPSFCSLYCEFDSNLCSWKSSSGCELKLITSGSLDGDTGYLIANRSTCEPSEISLDVLNQEGPFKFRLKYSLIGPGPAVLSIVGKYTMSENRKLWWTERIGNASWNHHDIVTDRGEINVLESISIKAYTSDSSAVAIGSISKIEDLSMTTEFNVFSNSSTIRFQTDSNRTNNRTQTHFEYILSRITVYSIGAAVGLVSVIVITVTIYCVVCD